MKNGLTQYRFITRGFHREGEILTEKLGYLRILHDNDEITREFLNVICLILLEEKGWFQIKIDSQFLDRMIDSNK